MTVDRNPTSDSGYPRILDPLPPRVYWYETSFKDDPHFDHVAVEDSAKAVDNYLQQFTQDGRAPYPPRLVRNPMTGLPALMNGYLLGDAPDAPIAAPPSEPEHLTELATRWLQSAAVSLTAFGLEPAALFAQPQDGVPPRLARAEWRRSSLNSGVIDEAVQGSQAQRDTFRQLEAEHLYWQQWVGRWPVYGGQVGLHGGTKDIRISLSSSFLPIRRDANFSAKIDSEAALKIATAAFQSRIERFDLETWQVVLVPYAGSKLFILPFRDRFRLACCLEACTKLGDDVWRVFVDAEDAEGIVLGPIERLAWHTDVFFIETSSAASQPTPVLTETGGFSLADLWAALNPAYLKSVMDATGASLDVIGVPAPDDPLVVNIQVEAANIAYHTWRFVSDFVAKCGADADELHGYDFTYIEPRDLGFGLEDVMVAAHQAPPLSLVVGRQGLGELEMGFYPASSKNPKRIIYQTLSGPLILPDGKIIHNPSLDPEVIQHEMAHALMWLLNPATFREPNATVPFTRALLEGYASYFARSFAARHADDAGSNPVGLWAGAMYRSGEGWGDMWSFTRTTQVMGADKLAAPNAYPANASSDLPIYELGMVWARALWDVRTLLNDLIVPQSAGLDLADTLALDGYFRCHGLIASFEVAAEGVLDSATGKGLGAAIVQQMRDKFVARGICTS